MPDINLIHGDCIEFLKTYKDNQFDLAIVDPPYGINAANDTRFGTLAAKKSATKTKNYEKKDWDKNVPTEEYWNELFRVSKNQIVWGVNYFNDDRLLGGRVFWYKDVPDGYTKSKGELAFKSFGIGVDYIKITWHGMLQHDMKNKEIRVHPTQKPVKLYKWLLHKYAKEGDLILDTHLGGGSIAIACDDLGYDFTGLEIDKKYYEEANTRFNNYKNQLKLF